MTIDDRKKKILKAIIDDYINTAEPIGSRTLARKHELGLSSATIRNEMADLEELGFLAQPHTSAGRIPSDKGYRFYVDKLMDIDEIEVIELEKIKNDLEYKISEVEVLIRAAASILARSTMYTSVATASNINCVTLKAIQLMWIDEYKVLVVIVASGNIIKNYMTKLYKPVLKDKIEVLSNLLNDKLKGLPLKRVMIYARTLKIEEYDIERDLYEAICKTIFECVDQIDVVDLFYEGTKNILNYPEFKNLERAKVFLDMFDKRDLIVKLFDNKTRDIGLDVHIGEENEIIEAKDCSIIITNYSLGDSIIGSIGVIGPTRMEYGKVIAYMNYLRNKLNQEIKKLIIE